jgi:hypothetical protein
MPKKINEVTIEYIEKDNSFIITINGEDSYKLTSYQMYDQLSRTTILWNSIVKKLIMTSLNKFMYNDDGFVREEQSSFDELGRWLKE